MLRGGEGQDAEYAAGAFCIAVGLCPQLRVRIGGGGGGASPGICRTCTGVYWERAAPRPPPRGAGVLLPAESEVRDCPATQQREPRPTPYASTFHRFDKQMTLTDFQGMTRADFHPIPADTSYTLPHTTKHDHQRYLDDNPSEGHAIHHDTGKLHRHTYPQTRGDFKRPLGLPPSTLITT